MATAYESSAWAQVKEGWRQLYGSFAREGVSVENHEFEATAPVNWGRSFHRNSVELCLNLRGTGTVHDGQTDVDHDDGRPVSIEYGQRIGPIVRRGHVVARFF